MASILSRPRCVLNDAPLMLRGLGPCQSPMLTLNEPDTFPLLEREQSESGRIWSGRAGVQRILIGGRSVLVGVGS